MERTGCTRKCCSFLNCANSEKLCFWKVKFNIVALKMASDTCRRDRRQVQALYWINLELIAKKGFFADFTPTGTLGHHIKNVSKSTLGKLLKIVVLKHRVSYRHENEAWNKLLTFKPTCNKNITEKLSTHITEIFNKQYLQFPVKRFPVILLKIKFWKNPRWRTFCGKNCYHSNIFLIKT